MAMIMKEALRIINLKENGLPVPFSIEFISFDSNKHRSKEQSSLKLVEDAIKVRSGHNSKRNASITVKRLKGRGVETIHFKLIMKLNGIPVL